jgi:two-component system OmpR family response regulator
MRILIVEDDVRLADVIRRGLAESGHVVDVEGDGEAGEGAALGTAFDALVLDVMLPRKDGFAVARALREAGLRTPILMLTARDTPEDVVRGLDSGADDYLRKPFDFAELEARLRSILRRTETNPGKLLRVADVELDLAARTACRGERALALTTREVAFLELFMRHAGRLVTRRTIEDALWERDRESGASNVIDVYVRRLRAKLSERGEPPLIHTVRRAGFRFGALDD